MDKLYAKSQLEIIRRSADRGMALALKRDKAFVDIFQHILDETKRLHDRVDRLVE